MKPASSSRVAASCGVSRQYTGSAEKITNCQIGVFAAPMSRATVMHSSTGLCICRRPGRLTRPGWPRRTSVPDGTTFATQACARCRDDRARDCGRRAVRLELQKKPTASMGSAMSRWSCGAPARATCLALLPAITSAPGSASRRSPARHGRRSRALSIPRDGNACPRATAQRRAAARPLGVLRELADLDAAEYDDARIGLWTRGLLIPPQHCRRETWPSSRPGARPEQASRCWSRSRDIVGRSKIASRPRKTSWASTTTRPALGTAGIATSRSSCSPSPWWPPFGIAQTPRRPQKECAGRRTHLARR